MTTIYRNTDIMSIAVPIGKIIRLVDMSAVGDRVRQLRKERGWTQTELAKRAKIAQSSVAELETKPNRGSRYIVKIAVALGVSAYWLDSGKGPKKLDDVTLEILDLHESELDVALAMIRMIRARRAA